MNSEDRLTVFIVTIVILAILLAGGSCRCMVHIKDSPDSTSPSTPPQRKGEGL